MIQSQSFDVIIFQDYNKGLLTESLILTAIKTAKNKGIPLIVDPKKENFLSYHGVDIFKPNLKEIKEGLNVDFDETSEAELLKNVDGLRNNQKENAVYREKAHKRNIIDVSGAGDTVVSVAALALACNIEDDFLMRIANLAGGLVCEKVGVTPIQREDLLKANLV
jgi:bifunctional ADP-heptose synthase (sugar kinase/adenylyltransferase)